MSKQVNQLQLNVNAVIDRGSQSLDAAMKEIFKEISENKLVIKEIGKEISENKLAIKEIVKDNNENKVDLNKKNDKLEASMLKIDYDMSENKVEVNNKIEYLL